MNLEESIFSSTTKKKADLYFRNYQSLTWLNLSSPKFNTHVHTLSTSHTFLFLSFRLLLIHSTWLGRQYLYSRRSKVYEVHIGFLSPTFSYFISLFWVLFFAMHSLYYPVHRRTHFYVRFHHLNKNVKRKMHAIH